MKRELVELTEESWLKRDKNYGLFLDIDGTLAPFEINPKHSKIPIKTLNLLKALKELGVPIAIVTGRSLSEARQLLQWLDMPIGATHGLEIAFSNQHKPTIKPSIETELVLIIQQIEQQIISQPLSNFLLEKKPYSVALHYRQNPELAETVKHIMQKVACNFTDWHAKQGKFVWEILPNGANKGVAVTAILEKFNANQKTPCFPIFIGDDISDEAGFLAVQANGGIGIKVGEPIDYPSVAQFFVLDIDAVSQVLQQLFDHYNNNRTYAFCSLG